MKKILFLGVLFTGFLVGCSKVKFLPFDEGEQEHTVWLDTGVNQLENGDFSKESKHWNFYLPTGNAKAVYMKGRVEVTESSLGMTNYGVQYYYDGFRLYKTGQYTLKFTAQASQPKLCEYRIQLNGGDYHAYAMDTKAFTTEPTEYVINFTMNEASDVAPRLVFNMGKFPDEKVDLPVKVTISNVSLVLNNEIAPKDTSASIPDVRINQIGYLPKARKIGYVKVQGNGLSFSVIDEAGKVVYSHKLGTPVRDENAREYVAPADFSKVTDPGTYTLKVGDSSSYPFKIGDHVYDDLMTGCCRFFYLQRCGTVDDAVFGHPACHQLTAFVIGTSDTLNATGGWHDAGDYGRYTVSGAKAVIDLLIAADASKGSYSGFDILAETKWELDWMLKMQRSDGAVYHKISCHKFPPFEMPQYETGKLIVCEPSTPATGDFTAVMAMASISYKDTDPQFATTALAAAEKAWAYIDTHPNHGFSNPSNVETGEYGDYIDADERYFAAAALFAATGDQTYIAKAKTLLNERWVVDFGWQCMDGYGDELIIKNAERIEDREFVDQIKKKILSRADELIELAKKSGYGLAMDKYEWGSNMDVANRAHLLKLTYTIKKRSQYIDTAYTHLSYLLGVNPIAECYVTGFGERSPQHPHHRPSIACKQPMPGMLVGGPDEKLEDPFAQNILAGKAPMCCYLDNDQSYSTNEETVYWNSILVTCLAELEY